MKTTTIVYSHEDLERRGREMRCDQFVDVTLGVCEATRVHQTVAARMIGVVHVEALDGKCQYTIFTDQFAHLSWSKKQ